MIKLYQGETVYIETDVKNNLGLNADLSGAEAVFSYKKGTTIVNKNCTILGNIVKAKFEPAETKDLLGKYYFEIKLKDVNGDVDTILTGFMEVYVSNIPVFPTT